jgi:hypothetical protein
MEPESRGNPTQQSSLTWNEVEPTLSLEKSRLLVGSHLAELANTLGLNNKELALMMFRDEVIMELGFNHLAPIIKELRDSYWLQSICHPEH